MTGKRLAAIAIAVIVIVAAFVGAYWWFFLREAGPKPGVSLSVSPSEVEPGESITVSGLTSPAVAGATVTLTYTKPDSNCTRTRERVDRGLEPLRTNFTRMVIADSDGKFTDTYSSELTDPTGKWFVTAEVEGATSDPATFYVFESPPIKVGLMRDKLAFGRGIEEGARLATEEINDAGGVLGRKFVLYFGDEGTEPATGKAEMERLITVEKVDFLVGGYRTENVKAMKETAMDYKKIFIMDAATTELLNCWGSLTEPIPCHHCVRDNYDRYKYLFRIFPPNSSAVFGFLLAFLKGYMLPEVFHGTEESPVKIAGVIEDLTWTAVLDWYFRNNPTFVTGLKGYIVYYARPSATETDFTAILSAIRDSGAKIIIHVLSGEGGIAFIKQWGEMQIPAIPTGVNVLSQGSEMWELSGEKCEYETIISSPVRANITEKTIPFWDRYKERWEHDPIFTAFGGHDGIYTLAEAIERAGTLDTDTVVAELEKTDRIGLSGRFKFTIYHDILIDPMYEVDLYGNYHWLTTKYIQPIIVQWRKPSERVIICPFNRTYTEDFELPPWM